MGQRWTAVVMRGSTDAVPPSGEQQDCRAARRNRAKVGPEAILPKREVSARRCSQVALTPRPILQHVQLAGSAH